MKASLGALGRGLVWLFSLGIILFIGVALTYGLAALRAANAQEGKVPPPVEVVTVLSQDSYRAIRRFPGRIDAAQVSDLSFQVGGEITQVLAKVGDKVAEGDPLARLDETRLKNRIGELKASRTEADAALTRAQASLERIRALREEGFSTDQDLDNITAERDGFRARIRQLNRSLANAEEDLADSTLTAPYGGVVVNRYLDAGATVAAGQSILRLNETGILEALIGVPPLFARRISTGDVFSLSSDGLTTDGVVTGIGDAVERATQTVSIRLEITEDPGFIPGSLVRLTLNEERRETGFWVPAQSLTEGFRGLWSVYVITQDENNTNVVARKDVEILHVGNERLFVRGTLEDGDRVVTAAPSRFVPGQQVTPIEAAPLRSDAMAISRNSTDSGAPRAGAKPGAGQ